MAILDGKRKASQKSSTRADQLDVKQNQAVIAKMSQTGLITKGSSGQASSKNSHRSRNYKVKLTSGTATVAANQNQSILTQLYTNQGNNFNLGQNFGWTF